MAFLMQMLISLMQGYITSIIMSLLHKEILCCPTLDLKSSVNDELPRGLFKDVKEWID